VSSYGDHPGPLAIAHRGGMALAPENTLAAFAIGAMARLLRAHPGWSERVLVAGAWSRWLDRLRAEAPGVSTALGWRSLTTLIACSRGGVRPPGLQGDVAARGGFAHVPIRLGRLPVHSERVIRRAHELGIRVVVWTVDDPATMRALLDMGVDGIITDRPDVLREVLISRGQWASDALEGLRGQTVRDGPEDRLAAALHAGLAVGAADVGLHRVE
jgi:glycerophosphoryl diester phosphodiesterase